MRLIHVSTEFPVAVQDGDGTWYRIEGTTSRTLLPIPASAYRRNAWMGLFTRKLVRVRGYGREFFIDYFWQQEMAVAALGTAAEAARPAWVPVAPPITRSSGCGCGRKAG